MSYLIKYFIVLFCLLLSAGCSDDNPVDPEPPTVIIIKTSSASDSSVVSGSNVTLHNADNSEAVARAFTNAEGNAEFTDAAPGNYFVKISAQGFREIPQQNITPVPFSVSQGETESITYYLEQLPGSWGKLDGYINPAVQGVLVFVHNQDDNSDYKTYSGPDGYFVLHNLSYGSYTVNAVKAAYSSDTVYTAQISQTSSVKTLQIYITQKTGSTLNGSVTFLAADNGIVDISILNRENAAAVNGLSTVIDGGRNYTIQNIPEGSYYAWASYKNDGYVMDPDWIFKNPGALEIDLTADTILTLNFSVTDAVDILSPSNPADTIQPVLVDSADLTFSWDSYPQAKEYIIEVKDLNGNIIWGGFSESGIINHAQIPKELTSIRFNFDGSAVSLTEPGQIYQWRIYVDDDAADNIQTLLSSSEDLMGLFKIK